MTVNYVVDRYLWKRNGIDLNPSGYDGRFVQLSDEGTIVINAPEDKDEGIFQCIADNNFGISVSININFRFVLRNTLSFSCTCNTIFLHV